jgi:four helix bundle protein
VEKQQDKNQNRILMQKISSYQQLEIWQKSMILVTTIYQITSTFPKAEIFGLTIQMRRAAVSIPSNIAEGWGRKLTKEFIQYLRIARGSLLELETHLIISQNLGYIENQISNKLLLSTLEINKMINSMISSLEKK